MSLIFVPDSFVDRWCWTSTTTLLEATMPQYSDTICITRHKNERKFESVPWLLIIHATYAINHSSLAVNAILFIHTVWPHKGIHQTDTLYRIISVCLPISHNKVTILLSYVYWNALLYSRYWHIDQCVVQYLGRYQNVSVIGNAQDWYWWGNHLKKVL